MYDLFIRKTQQTITENISGQKWEIYVRYDNPLQENSATTPKMTKSELSYMLYVGGLPPTVDEKYLETLFSQYGLAIDANTQFADITIFLCPSTFTPRGDALLRFTTARGCDRALQVNGSVLKECTLRCRPLDASLFHFLAVQYYTHRKTWTCPSIR